MHRATRLTHSPTLQDWKLAKKIARYLSGTNDLKLSLKIDGGAAPPVRVRCYSDADFAGDSDDRKSASAAAVHVNGMLVEWHCTTQSTVTTPTVEAAFVAAAVCGQSALGVRELLLEIRLVVETPILLLMDNKAAMLQIRNEASSASVKHVDVKLKFLRNYASKGTVKTEHVGTLTTIADLLTKALPASRNGEL